jgi:hypothetical protein
MVTIATITWGDTAMGKLCSVWSMSARAPASSACPVGVS